MTCLWMCQGITESVRKIVREDAKEKKQRTVIMMKTQR